MRSHVSKFILVTIDQVRQRKSSARQESMALVATQRVKTAMLDSSKISQETQHATGVPSDTAISCSVPPVATLSHLDFSPLMDSSRLVHEVSRAQAPTNLRNDVQQEHTPTALDLCRAFPVPQERLRV